MVNRKCVICKNNNKSQAYWPTTPKMKNRWMQLLDKNFPQGIVSTSSGLCRKHFRPEDFTDWIAYHAKGNNYYHMQFYYN